LQLDNSAKETHYCISMATLNTFMLLAVISTQRIKKEHIIEFPQQQLLQERATTQRST
jgi:hypothetical protein